MRSAWLLAIPCCVACNFGEGDAKVPGEALGTFSVVAELADTSCGDGALGSKDIWEFDIKLSKDFDQLFWLNGREVIPGKLASDGRSFEIDSWVHVEVIESGAGNDGCTLTREDHASGMLDSEDDVQAFAGELTFDYIPHGDSNCTPLLGIDAGFATLPCRMSYSLDATLRPEK